MKATAKTRRQAEMARAWAVENRTKGPANEIAVTAPKRAMPGGTGGEGWLSRTMTCLGSRKPLDMGKRRRLRSRNMDGKDGRHQMPEESARFVP
jgi:hypothetical protein